MPQRHWIVKSEPYKYSFAQLMRDGRTVWDGVRNFEARRNLREMQIGDLLLYYHSNEGLAVVGVARVVRTAYQDPTTSEDWSAVDVEPVLPLQAPVPLVTIKDSAALGHFALVRRSRLSVAPVTTAEFREVLRLGQTPWPAADAPAAAPRPALGKQATRP